MSIGIFRSIRGSFMERSEAERIIRALNAHLRNRGLPEYRDPEPGEKGLRMLPCGNAGGRTFCSLDELAGNAGVPWTLGNLKGSVAAALPIEFSGKLSVRIGRVMLLFPQVQEFISVRTVRDELLGLARALKIPLEKGVLSESLATRLSDCLGVSDDELPDTFENERALWVDLYYAAAYGLEDSTPIVLH